MDQRGKEMMMYSIENDYLKVQISSKGAELMSIQGADGTEYLWQGDEKYWGDRALNIFPYVARLTDGCYTYQGNTYRLPIHGFAPMAEFEVVEHEKDSITFQIKSNEEFYKMYPFLFKYNIHYYIEETELFVEMKVENVDNKAMFFGFGGHPGINVPMEEGLSFEDYFLEFPECNPRRVEFSRDCFVTGNEPPYELEDGKILCRHEMFDEDAIVLKGMAGTVTLKSNKGTKSVTMHAKDFPIYGFWHMPKTDAPYICLEPWSSLPSRQGVIEDLEKQEDLIRLESQETCIRVWSLKFTR